MKQNTEYAVPAIVRCVRVLEFVGDRGGASFSEICAAVGLSKSSAYGIINTLLQCGLLRSKATGGYRLGFKLFALGSRAIADMNIRLEAQPLMQRLVDTVNQTSHLGFLDGDEAVYLAKVNCKQNLIVRSWVGMRLSLQTSAMGKALLAWRDEAWVRELLGRVKPQRRTVRSILDVEAFMEHLEGVRKHGFAIDNQENADNVFCVGAPVFSTERDAVGAISVSVPYDQMNAGLFESISRNIHETCKELSYKLGASFYPSFNPMPYPGETNHE